MSEERSPEAVIAELRGEVEGLKARFTAPIVCMCGSTRFKQAWISENARLTGKGNIVLAVGLWGHHQQIAPTPEQKIELDALHKCKIDLCDWVWVLDVGGYIGESTRSEINYALALGKCVRYLSMGFPDYEEPKDEVLQRAETAEARERRLHEALELSAVDTCSLHCPSTWKTGNNPPHSEKCRKVRAALSASPEPPVVKQSVTTEPKPASAEAADTGTQDDQIDPAVVDAIRRRIDASGLTPSGFADAMNALTPEQIRAAAGVCLCNVYAEPQSEPAPNCPVHEIRRDAPDAKHMEMARKLVANANPSPRDMFVYPALIAAALAEVERDALRDEKKDFCERLTGEARRMLDCRIADQRSQLDALEGKYLAERTARQEAERKLAEAGKVTARRCAEIAKVRDEGPGGDVAADIATQISREFLEPEPERDLVAAFDELFGCNRATLAKETV